MLQYKTIPNELQEKFWRDPSEHADEVIDYFLSMLSNNLVNEVKKLPEIAGTASYSINKIDLVKGLENITSLTRSYNNLQLVTYLLEFGYSNIRKYCCPLQALLWSCMEELHTEEENLNYVLSCDNLIKCWGSFKGEKWQDFNEVSDRLNFPLAIIHYMSSFSYKFDEDWKRTGEWATAEDMFYRKAGDCEDHAAFAAYCLVKNGYEAYGIYVKGSKRYLGKYDVSHVACIYKEKINRKYYTIDVKGYLQGPFDSIEAAAMQTGNYVGLGYEKHRLMEMDLSRKCFDRTALWS